MNEEILDQVTEDILDLVDGDYSYTDRETNIEGNIFTVTYYGGGTWYDADDEWETTLTFDLSEVAKFLDSEGNVIDQDAYESYILSKDREQGKTYPGQEFYAAGEKAIEDKYGCTGAYLEPSTQGGRGGTFLFADDMQFEGNFDYQTGEEYIHANDLEGFINLVLSSFTPVLEENKNSSTDEQWEDASYYDVYSLPTGTKVKVSGTDWSEEDFTITAFVLGGDRDSDEVRITRKEEDRFDADSRYYETVDGDSIIEVCVD